MVIKLPTNGIVCFLNKKKVDRAITAKIEMAVCFVRKASENKIPAIIEFFTLCFPRKYTPAKQRKINNISTRAISNQAPPNLNVAANEPAATKPINAESVLSLTA